MSGLLPEAEALLSQVWELRGAEPGLRDAAAWHLAWVLLLRGAYAEATDWFARVTAPPASGGPIWSAIRPALLRRCHEAGRAAPAVAALQRPPAESAGALPPLRVASLGQFQLFRDGELLSSRAERKPLAVLRYLLTRREYAAHKEELMEIFWPDASPRVAAHSVHVAVSKLRAYLDVSGESYVLLDGGWYRLNSRVAVDDDCARFEEHLAAAGRWSAAERYRDAEEAFKAALVCYRGDFDTSDLGLTWALAERERLRARYLEALEQLGALLLAQRRYAEAIAPFQALVERDSYREDIHGQLVRCFSALGRRAEALRQYERCAAILAQDLGVAPSPEFQALRRGVVDAVATPTGTAGAPARTARSHGRTGSDLRPLDD